MDFPWKTEEDEEEIRVMHPGRLDGLRPHMKDEPVSRGDSHR